MKHTLKGKSVFITGASLGIGTEAALKFAKEGCRLALTYYRDKGPATEVAERCKKSGSPDVLLLQLDLTNDTSIRESVKAVVGHFKEISILINNAGMIVWKPFAEQNFQEIEEQIRTNYTGLVKMTRECLPHVKEMIINLGSAAGKAGYADLTTYCGTKFAVRGFSQALAQELSDVQVFTVNPGVTATRMNDFRGMPPGDVAEVIVNTAKGDYNLESGYDVDVWKVTKR